jgi:hypothetical protein
LTQTTIDGTDHIILYVPNTQSFEAVVSGPKVSAPSVSGAKGVSAKLLDSKSVVITGTPAGLSAVRFGNTAVLVTDKVTAKSFWQPHTSTSYDVSPSGASSVLVAGPYLVRNATVAGSTLALVGDTNATTTLTVIAPSAVKKVTWNGAAVSVSSGPAGGLVGKLGAPAKVSLPSLKSAKWKAADSLPEVDPKFDDSAWVVANKTSVARKQKPYSGKYVLYADEYGTCIHPIPLLPSLALTIPTISDRPGFHSGNFIFRGYFKGQASAIDLSVEG